MADPKPYKRGYSFENYQADVPDQPLPGVNLDIELDKIAGASDELTARVNAGIDVSINQEALEAVAGDIDRVVFVADNMDTVREVAELGPNLELATDLFLGAFANDPDTAGDGGPLAIGATYYNTLIGESRVWAGAGAGWIPVAKVSTGGVLQGGVTADGSTDEFMVGDYVSLMLARNGLVLEPGPDYTMTAPTVTVPGTVDGDQLTWFAILKGTTTDAAAFVRQTVLTTAGRTTYATNTAGESLNLTQTNHVLFGGSPFGMLTYGVDYTVADGELVLDFEPAAGELFHIFSMPRFTNSEAQAILQDLREGVADQVVAAEAAAEAAKTAASTTSAGLPTLLSSTVEHPVGSVILTRAEGHSYEVVASGGDMVTAGGVQLRRIIRDKDVRAPVKYQAYHPTITSVEITAEANLYRHVPTIISTGPGRLMVAYQFNDTTSTENANPRLIGIHRSTDYGATWTARATELLAPATCENPQTYTPADTRNGEPFAVYYQGREYLFYQTRFVAGNFNDGMMAIRDPAGGKWRQYRLLFAAGQTETFTFSDTSIEGNAPAGWDRGVMIGGARFAPNFYKPFEDNLGRLIVPVTFFSSWEVDHRLRFLVLEAGQWRLTDWVPLGDASMGGAWEPTAWQAEDGTYYVLARDHARGRQTTGSTKKHMLTASADLQVWRPWEHAGMLMDNSRSMRRKIRSGLWMGVVPTADGRRNSLELFASGDGANWTWGGFPVSREQRYVNTSSGQEIGYSDLTDLGNGQVGVVYSRRPPTSTASYTEIHFARFNLPPEGRLPVMGSNKYRYDLSTTTSLVGGDPVVSGSELTIQSRMRGVIPTRGDYYVLTVAARVTAIPAARPYQILSIGDDDSGYWSIEYRRNATDDGTDLYIGGEALELGIAATETRTFQIAVDTAERRVYCMGRRYDFGGYPYVIIGNTAADAAFNGGPIIYDAARFSLVEYKHGLPSLFRKFRANRTTLNLPPAPITIRNGGIPGGGSSYSLATEGDAATDDLVWINGGIKGDILILQIAETGKAVTVKHGTGNIYCGGSDKVLSSVQHRIMLHCAGPNWHMVSAQAGT